MKSKLIKRQLEGSYKENVVASEPELATTVPTPAEVKVEATPKEQEDPEVLVSYDITRDTTKGGNNFVAVEIKYKIEDGRVKVISGICKSFYDKTTGMILYRDKENKKYLFEKNRGVRK